MKHLHNQICDRIELILFTLTVIHGIHEILLFADFFLIFVFLLSRDLSSNNIEILPADVFSPLKKLTSLYVS